MKIVLSPLADYNIKSTFNDHETVQKLLESFGGIKALEYTDFVACYEYNQGDLSYPVVYPKNVQSFE